MPQTARTMQPERAALLLVDEEGAAKILCLPERGPPRDLFAGVRLRQLLDVAGGSGGPRVAALLPGRTAKEPWGPLVLLTADAAPRTMAVDARTARFSPGGDALAFQSSKREVAGGGALVEVSRLRVLDLASGEVVDLGEAVDPLWEADGKHLRATGLVRTIEDRRTRVAVRWRSLRLRWDRESMVATAVGRGSAQLPAPSGAALAWSDDERTALLPSYCAVRAGRGGYQHAIVGPFCMGIADDRGVRWSPDGRWLAFPQPESARREGGAVTCHLDVVSVEGGRDPALTALYKRIDPAQQRLATAPGSVWIDWSPVRRSLVVQDGAGDLRRFDLEDNSVSQLGKGEKPMWSPGGGYLLALAVGQGTADGRAPSPRRTGELPVSAFLLSGSSASARIELGPVRDARWLPATACGSP
jgi:hypothetical protein